MNSPPMRNRGRAWRHWLLPALRYVTATAALRLSSPLIFHSNPSDLSVGRSMTKAPAVTALSAARAGADSASIASRAERRVRMGKLRVRSGQRKRPAPDEGAGLGDVQCQSKRPKRSSEVALDADGEVAAHILVVVRDVAADRVEQARVGGVHGEQRGARVADVGDREI